MQIGIQSHSYLGSKPTIFFKNLKILPAQALLNLSPKGQPLQDPYWNELAVSRSEPTGVFLPMGRGERIEQDYKTKKCVYHFVMPESEIEQWYYYAEQKKETVFPSKTIEARTIEKIDDNETILKFELRPVSIGTNGEFRVLPPLRFRSAVLTGSVIDHFREGRYRDGIFWSTDGKTWKPLGIEMTANNRWSEYPKPIRSGIFPCDRFYLKFKRVQGIGELSYGLSYGSELYVDVGLDTDQYYDYGQTSYFRVVPGEAKESDMKINPLYTARNQVYFLYRNETDKEAQPEFAARLRYSYYSNQGGIEQTKEVAFRATGNTKKEFDDVTCHWEVLGDGNKIPPGEERICVFTLETSKLRASSHAQRGPYVSDVFDVEFGLGTYKMVNERMRFFPPRLEIE
jgi:hypothetical protein